MTPGLESILQQQTVERIWRRGKYILIEVNSGVFLIHLGMSGSLRIVKREDKIEKHDHFDLVTTGGGIARFRDPRRFGCLLWAGEKPLDHPLICGLGVEPLSDEFNGEYLSNFAKARSSPIKNIIMNARIVVGVGNIYASESLFRAGIHPLRSGRRISAKRLSTLVSSIKHVLKRAIDKGGTTLQDFVGADGQAGYFDQKLNVYGRSGQHCYGCDSVIRNVVIAQRSTFYCPSCQR